MEIDTIVYIYFGVFVVIVCFFVLFF
uniref:NERD domain-containing protein n=1 Tax=Anguilla anguilla TaxID=7936 RepID=A0A0E9QL97_ANGAN